MANRKVSYSGRGIFSFLVKYNEYASLILVNMKFFKPRNSQKRCFSCLDSSNSARSMLHQWRAACSRSFTPRHDMRETGWSYPFSQCQSFYRFMQGELYKKSIWNFAVQKSWCLIIRWTRQDPKEASGKPKYLGFSLHQFSLPKIPQLMRF